MLQRIIEILAQKCSTPLFAPHVTLLGQLSQEADWIKIQLEKLSAGVPVLQLDISQLSMTDQYFRSIILKIAPNTDLDLFYRAAASVFPIAAEVPFVPHLSLLYSDLEWPKKRQVMENVSIPTSITVRIKEVVLMETKGQPEHWREVARIPLKHTISSRK